jgi:hypothetical protein
MFFANRDSPAREIQNIAKKRALERRERERLREQSKPRKKVGKSPVPVLTVLYVPSPEVFPAAMSHGSVPVFFYVPVLVPLCEGY